ncbi:MAG: hypothetical protein NTY47_03755 [Candidatus Omnitrophica bacterium]|nr:hypothetical protein [Candidatus Omnitrophota bacterium]
MQRFLTKREQLILYLALGVIAFGAVFNIFFSPLIQKGDNLGRDIKLTRSKLKKYSRLLSQKDYIRDKYNKFSGGSALPQGNESNALSGLAEMENIAKDSNVHIIDIRTQTQKSVSNRSILIDVRAEASLESFLRFIYGIENSFSALKIKKFQIESHPGSTALEGTFTISQISASE